MNPFPLALCLLARLLDNEDDSLGDGDKRGPTTSVSWIGRGSGGGDLQLMYVIAPDPAAVLILSAYLIRKKQLIYCSLLSQVEVRCFTKTETVIVMQASDPNVLVDIAAFASGIRVAVASMGRMIAPSHTPPYAPMLTTGT